MADRKWMKGKESCLLSALLHPVPRSRVLHMRESEKERERTRKTEFHTVQLLHPGSYYSVWKEDHPDDTEFIPLSYLWWSTSHLPWLRELISILIQTWPMPIPHTWLFTWAPMYANWYLIKWSSSTYECVMCIQINNKSLTYFPLLMLSNKPLITLLQQANYMWQRRVKCKSSSSEVFIFKGQM